MKNYFIYGILTKEEEVHDTLINSISRNLKIMIHNVVESMQFI